VNGSFQWLDYFKNYLLNKGVNINFGVSDLHVNRENGKMIVYNGCVRIDQFDKVIFATHADDTYNMIDFKSQGSDPMIEALPQFSYDSCNVYVHQDRSVLPPQGDCNETYNIHIYSYGQQGNPPIYTPYNITYVVNMHQNDAARGIKDPLFFVTVNPFAPIDQTKVLKQDNGQPATSSFKHCKLDFKAMNAQMTIDKLQLHTDGPRDYYFAGSFTRGAGLHVECVIQADEIATKIANPLHVSEQTYILHDNKPHVAPRYIMDRIAGFVKKNASELVTE
jgi:uncharacterized protein